MLLQLHNTFFMTFQRLWHTVQDDTFEQSYTKVTFHTLSKLYDVPVGFVASLF